MVLSAGMAAAQTNGSAALILSPADWDAGNHMLASLVATDKPGEYALPLAWAGAEKVTARTGWYATKEAVAEEKDQWLEFDKFTVGSRTAGPRLREDRFLSKGGQGSGWAYYRASLPSDIELFEIRDVLSVSNLFGWNPFSQATNNAGETVAVSIRYFSLRPSDAIETLQVTFTKRGQESTIESILLKRGRLSPQRKKP